MLLGWIYDGFLRLILWQHIQKTWSWILITCTWVQITGNAHNCINSALCMRTPNLQPRLPFLCWQQMLTIFKALSYQLSYILKFFCDVKILTILLNELNATCYNRSTRAKCSFAISVANYEVIYYYANYVGRKSCFLAFHLWRLCFSLRLCGLQCLRKWMAKWWIGVSSSNYRQTLIRWLTFVGYDCRCAQRENLAISLTSFHTRTVFQEREK